MSKRSKASGYGFAKPSEIGVQSVVAAGTLKPAVHLCWGKEEGQLTPHEARAHAFSLMNAAAAADLDACMMQWAIDKHGFEPERAVQLLHMLREQREVDPPSCTMNLGNESIRPETARQRAQFLLDNAFNTEMEAFLALFLLRDLEQPGEAVDELIQEFRAMRGLITAWPTTEEGERDG